MVKSVPAQRRSWLWVAVLAMMIVPGIVSLLYLRSAPRKPLDSIAVLPFTNSSGDSEATQLGDRITADLILRLSQISNLTVVPREAILPYRDEARTVQIVGHELGVRAILRGRIERRADRILISAELIDAGDDAVLWSRQYELSGDDEVATFQEEIARHLTRFIRSQ